MALSLLTADVENVQALSDQPNDNDGLSADELKAIFDKAAMDIKSFLNGVHIPEVEDAIDAAARGISQSGVSGNVINDGTITSVKLCQDEGLEAVTTDNMRNYCVTLEKLDPSLATLLDTLSSGFQALSAALDTKANSNEFAKVARSGKYADLSGLPTIPNVDASFIAGSTNPVQSKIVQTALSGKSPTSHAVNANTYGLGSNSVYGHVKLSDAVNSSSTQTAGVAATPKAVKDAYDLANSKAAQSTVNTLITTVNGKQPEHLAVKNIKLSKNTRSWTVSVTGVNATNTVLVSPQASSVVEWADHYVRPSAQGSNSLSFIAETNTENDIYVDVVILN